jgi:plasmid segregation protein ParM
MAIDEKADELAINLLVVGLPCNTYAKFHERLAQRMRGEHLIGRNGQIERRITVESVRVVPQPQGAVVHWGSSTDLANAMSLVLDAGGGTFDWFVTKGRQALWQRAGAYPKGMLACASAVIKLIEPEWLNDHSVVERVDAAIRANAESFKVGQKTFMLANYRKTIDAVLHECIAKMISVAGRIDTMDQILVTGGGANVFGEFLRKQNPSIAAGVKIDKDPIYSNVRGFQVIGEIMHRQGAA